MKILILGFILGILAGLTLGNVKAEDRPQHMTCADVRAVVALVGEKEAERLARNAGASEERIAWARSCLQRK